jgi:hypothetical protein
MRDGVFLVGLVLFSVGLWRVFGADIAMLVDGAFFLVLSLWVSRQGNPGNNG